MGSEDIINSEEPKQSLVVRPQDVSAIPKLTLEARRAKVWDFRIKGVSVSAISKVFGVTEKTIYDDLKAIGVEYRDQLLQMDAIELVASNLQWLDELERIALHEVAQAQPVVTKTVDEKTGVMSETSVSDPNKGRFYMAALKARELKLKILLDTGIIPKNKTELFDRLEKLSKTEVEVQEDRTDKEILVSIERLMKHGRFMKSTATDTPPNV